MLVSSKFCLILESFIGCFYPAFGIPSDFFNICNQFDTRFFWFIAYVLSLCLSILESIGASSALPFLAPAFILKVISWSGMTPGPPAMLFIFWTIRRNGSEERIYLLPFKETSQKSYTFPLTSVARIGHMTICNCNDGWEM